MDHTSISFREQQLRDALKMDPSDWGSRKRLAHLLYDEGSFQKAADTIWAADEIPSIDLELAFAARVLAKAAPRKAIRLLTAVLEHNGGKAVQNLGLANALLHHGMVIQAARFYGAALESDPSLCNPEFEHFILWTDDEATLWGNFRVNRFKLGDLPWMKRDPKEALKLTSKVDVHTTPIKLPNLEEGPGEDLKIELYQQTPERGAQPSPPPAVTIPLDRVAPKDRLFDPELGAPTKPESQEVKPDKKPDTAKPVELAMPTMPAPASNPEPAAAAPVKPNTPLAEPMPAQTPLTPPSGENLPPVNPQTGARQLNKVNMPAPTKRPAAPPSRSWTISSPGGNLDIELRNDHLPSSHDEEGHPSLQGCSIQSSQGQS